MRQQWKMERQVGTYIHNDGLTLLSYLPTLYILDSQHLTEKERETREGRGNCTGGRKGWEGMMYVYLDGVEGRREWHVRKGKTGNKREKGDGAVWNEV